MATLKAVFAADGATTAANSSQISDGAAALLIASRAYAKQHGLKPRARFVSTAVAAADPVIQFTAVLDATRKALKESGLTLDDIDLFEVNEAFGGVPLMFQQEFGILDDRLNVNGGSIAIGHPLGSTGARMLTDLLCELERRGGRYGLQTICEASGTANATIIERRMSGATMSEASEVLVSRDGAIATLTINRPRAKNSEPRGIRWPACAACATARRRYRARGHHHRRRGRVLRRGRHHGLRCAARRAAAGRSCGGRRPLWSELGASPSPSSQRWKSSRWAAAQN